MAEADSAKISVAVGSSSETTVAQSRSATLAEGENLHLNFTGSSVNVVAGDQIQGNKIVYNVFGVHGPLGSERQPSSSGPAAIQQDCSDNAPAGEGWVSLNSTNTVYSNNLKPIKKGFRVYEGKQKLAGYWRDVAIKFIDYDKENFREITHMCNLISHPNVVEMYDAGVNTTEAQRYIYIVMQRCPKTLKDLMNENEKKTFQFDIYFSYAEQIVKAIEFIHRKGILHRDIKPENILVFPQEKNCRISDFGLSKQLQDGKSEDVISSQKAFTEGFEAPEIHGEPPTYSKRSDSFSVGIVLYMLFSGGVHPYGADVIRRRTNIIDNKDPDLSSIHKSMKSYPKKHEQLLDLIQNLLSHDPKKRSKPTEILKHPFFQDQSQDPQISSESVEQHDPDSEKGAVKAQPPNTMSLKPQQQHTHSIPYWNPYAAAQVLDVSHRSMSLGAGSLSPVPTGPIYVPHQWTSNQVPTNQITGLYGTVNPQETTQATYETPRYQGSVGVMTFQAMDQAERPKQMNQYQHNWTQGILSMPFSGDTKQTLGGSQSSEFLPFLLDNQHGTEKYDAVGSNKMAPQQRMRTSRDIMGMQYPRMQMAQQRFMPRPYRPLTQQPQSAPDRPPFRPQANQDHTKWFATVSAAKQK